MRFRQACQRKSSAGSGHGDVVQAARGRRDLRSGRCGPTVRRALPHGRTRVPWLGARSVAAGRAGGVVRRGPIRRAIRRRRPLKLPRLPCRRCALPQLRAASRSMGLRAAGSAIRAGRCCGSGPGRGRGPSPPELAFRVEATRSGRLRWPSALGCPHVHRRRAPVRGSSIGVRSRRMWTIPSPVRDLTGVAVPPPRSEPERWRCCLRWARFVPCRGLRGRECPNGRRPGLCRGLGWFGSDGWLSCDAERTRSPCSLR